MLKTLSILTCFAFLATPSFAQEKKLKVKYGKISEEEIAMTSYKEDPAAPAVVLFDKAEFSNHYNQSQGFLFEMERHVRIKIFKKEAYYLADVAIRHFSDEKILDLKATSYNVVNGALVETDIDKSNIFDEKLTRTRRLKKLTIPAVKEGTIIEYKYTRTNMGYDVPDWVFQDVDIPKIWSEYIASVPSFIEYRKFSQGEVPYSLAQDDERSHSGAGLNYTCHDMHYIQENIPALKPEPYVNSVKNYLSQISFDIRTIYRPQVEANGGAYGARLTNGPPKEILNTWGNLGNEFVEDVYADVLSSTKFTADATAACIAGKTSTPDKIAAIYEYIGKNYQSADYDMIWLSESFEKITKNHKGSPTDMNLVFINMLRRANLKAFPVAISTVENGRITMFRVTPDAFNRIITAVENDDKTLSFIDASAWPHPVGFLPAEDINNEGLLLREKGNITWEPLQNKALVRSALQAELAIDAEGKISGLMTFSETGYGAVKARTRVKEKDAPTYLKEKFPELFVDGTFSNLKIENLDSWQEPNIKGTFDLEATGFANVSGNKIYLNPSLGFGWKENPFKDPKRKFNVELGTPRTTVYSFVFAIPAGYKIEELPKGSKMTFGENGLIFEYFADQTPESVKITIRRSIRQPLIAVEHYADLQQFYGNIVSKLDEQVVLTKL